MSGPELDPEDFAADEHDDDSPREPLRLTAEKPAPKVRIGEPWEERLILATKTDAKTGNETKSIIPNAANVSTILRFHPDWRGVIARDEFTGQTLTTRPPPWTLTDAPATVTPGQWTDADTARTVNYFARTWVADMAPLSVSAKLVDQALSVVAECNPVHPVRDYLRSLAWDGVPRVDALAHFYFGTDDTPYAAAVGACFMIGAVARVMRPGCKVDLCPILEGKQGSFKSTALAILGGPWFADTKIHIGSKDAYEQIRGAWVYELGELASISRADVESTKAFISAASDHYRPSYGRHAVDVPRQCVFVGSTNGATYLADDTGARRFPPLRTGRIDTDVLRRDRDALWAEAVHRFDAGEPWHMRGELAAVAEAEAEDRRVRDPWEPSVCSWLAAGPPSLPAQREREGVTSADVLEALGVETAKRTRTDEMRVGALLRTLGWTRERVRKDGGRAYRFYKRGEP